MDILSLLINKDIRPSYSSRRRNWDEYFFSLNPLFPCASALVSGVFMAHVFPEVSAAFLILSMAVLLCLFLLLHRVPVLATGIVLLLFALLGALRLHFERSTFQIEFPPQPVISYAMITSEPAQHGKVVMCDMVFVKDPLRGKKIRASILGKPSYRIGDVVVINSRMNIPKNFPSNGKYKTDYTTYLKNRGIVAQTFVLPQYIRLCADAEVTLPLYLRLYRMALLTRSRLLHVFAAYRSDIITQGYLSAVLLGVRTHLSSQLRDEYSRSGVSHVLALSGMHLGIIYGLFSLFMLRKRSVFGQLLLLSMIWFYVLMVGFPISALRAAIMLSVCTLIHLMGRQGLTLNTLSFSALVMVLVHPYCVFDIGFQLSYLSVCFITMFFQPIFSLITPWYIGRIRICSWLLGIVAVSVAAQLGTFPLVLYYFGSFSFVFLLSNIIVVPLTTLVLSLGLVVLLLGLFDLYLPWLFQLLSFFVKSQNSVVSWLSSLPFSSLHDIQLTLLETAFLYFIVFSLIALFTFLSRRIA